jgi:hypothetical protein
MSNYALFKGNLHVKIVMTGNPFLFGRLQVAYLPLAVWGGSDRYSDGVGFGAQMVRSQRQMINLDPSVSTGGELVLPFIWHKDYLSVPDILTESLLLGQLTFDILDPLRNVSDNITSNVAHLIIYAWLENVELAGLTGSNITGMVAQSGNEQKAANDGKLSGPLATIGNSMTAMSRVPGLGGLATAGFVASTTSDIAKLFGYSRPNNQSEPNLMSPRTTSSLAYAVGGDNSLKLTLNPNQCVSVDPDIVGSRGDDMAFANIVTIPSLLTAVTWSKSAITGTSLFSTKVVPAHKYVDTGEYFMPAVTGAMLPFSLWNGSMRFRFDVISTAFHRGRLLLVYDPGKAKGNGQEEENIQYSAVVDLADARSFQAEIGYNSSYGLLRNYSFTTTPTFNETPVTSTLEQYDNGTLTLYVLNELTTPSSAVEAPSDVNVLVYVSGGEDLNGFSPRYPDIEWVATSGNEPINIGKGKDDRPAADLRVKFRSSDAVSSVLIGEVCPSIRYLLKRYSYYTTINHNKTSTSHMRFKHGMYPFPPLVNPDATAGNYLHRTTAGTGVNYMNMTYFAYFRPAFVTVRGGMRWKAIPNNASITTVVRKLLDTTHIGLLPYTEDYTVSGSKFARDAIGRYESSCEGTALTHSSVNGILEFEVPFHSHLKFYLGRNTDACSQAQGYLFSGFTLFTDSNVCTIYTAGAEDLTFGTFIGFPPYREPVVPDPAL